VLIDEAKISNLPSENPTKDKEGRTYTIEHREKIEYR
jgi:hypothetical protein